MAHMQRRTYDQREEDNRQKGPRLRAWKSVGMRIAVSTLEDAVLNGRKPGRANLIGGVRDVSSRRKSNHQGLMHRTEMTSVSISPVSQIEMLSNDC